MSLYGIKDASDLTIISNKTNKQVLFANYCNKTDINFTSSDVYALKKGVKAIGWSANREGTMSVEMQIFDLQWIALLMGSELSTGIVELNKHEVLTVTSASATLTETPKSGSLTVFILDDDGITHSTEQTAGTPATTPNTYSISGKTLTFNSTTFATDKKVVCYYLLDSASTNKSFTVSADKFPSGYTVIADTTIKTSENVEEQIQFKLPNVKPRSNMTLSMNSDTPTTLAIEWDIFADNDNNMFIFKTL
jgi:hypothetical protein